MKKQWIKSAMSVGLLLVLIVGLCACGKSGDNRSPENANAILATENVYRVNSTNILPWTNCEDSYINVQSAVCTDEGVFAVLELRDWLANKVYYGVLTADKELSDFHITSLELPEDIRYSNFMATLDKKIYGLCESTGELRDEQRAQVCCWDISGQMIWKSEITGLYGDEEVVDVQGIYAAGDGSINILSIGENAYKIHISRDGEPSGREQLSDKSAAMLSECFGIWPGADGSLRVMYPDEKNREKTYLTDYNVYTDTLGEPYELPFTFEWGIFGTVSAGMVSDLVYTKQDGISIYNRGDEQGTLKMNYINSDVNITSVDTLLEIDEGKFFAFYREDNEGTFKLGVFSYVKPEDVAEKKVIVLGGVSIDDVMRQQVVKFNRASDVYKIVLKEYAYDEYSDSYIQLNKDIIAGNMPDILVAAGLPVHNCIEKGLIADLKPLIEQDEELSKVEYMENVFEAYSVDGKLMYVVPSFMVSTAVAKTSIVGDGSDWSLEKMRQVFAEMDEGTQFMSEMTRDMFMEQAMHFCGNDFVDVETGKCAFDSEEFIALMEFAATLPEEIDRSTLYEGDYWEGYEAQYRDNMTLLMWLHIDCLNSSLNFQLNGYIGEDYTFVGFPGGVAESGSGAYIYSDDLMVLSAKSENLKGAWEFVRYYLTDEYQENLYWGLPVNKNICMEKAQRLTEHNFYMDGNGEKVEYEDTLYYHGEEVPVPPMTQTQLEQLLAYCGSVKTTSFVNEDVMSIISEEMGSFFAGDKTAAESAGVIQNRELLYVKENQ